jgi:hypothetical protein
MHKRALKKAQDVYTYSPLYKDLKDFYKFTINNNKDDFLRRFQGYEVLARKDILSTSTHYFIGHYDAAKRTKRRWCSITYQQLALVEINDDKYFSQYLPLIDEFVNVCIHGSVDGQQTLLESAFNKLKEIGWPEQYVLDKICADKIYRDKICADKIYGDKICADDHIERIVSSITKPMKKDSNLD